MLKTNVFSPIFSPIWTQFRPIEGGRLTKITIIIVIFEYFREFEYFQGIFVNSSIFEPFSWIRVSHLLPYFFREITDVRKYRIYSGLNSNLEKNPFRLSRNRKIRKKNPFALPYPRVIDIDFSETNTQQTKEFC